MIINQALTRATSGFILTTLAISMVSIITSCKSQQSLSALQDLSEERSQADGLTDDELAAVDLLITHCKACHAVGEYRFIDTLDYVSTWENLFLEKAPLSTSVWAEQILNSLSWPGDTPPTPSERYTDASRYMPLGSQRRRLHESRVGTMPAREFLIRELMAGSERRLENRSNQIPPADDEEIIN